MFRRIERRFQLETMRLRLLANGHRDSFDIFTHLTKNERTILYWLGLQCPKGSRFVEIGSYLGASSCFLGAAARERMGTLHCVDTWLNHKMSEGQRDTWGEFLRNTERYREVIQTHRGWSEDVAREFTQGIDLLFIDGDHSYEGCRRDVEAWLPKLISGGYVVFHDYDAGTVRAVVEELVCPISAGNIGLLNRTYWTQIERR